MVIIDKILTVRPPQQFLFKLSFPPFLVFPSVVLLVSFCGCLGQKLVSDAMY